MELISVERVSPQVGRTYATFGTTGENPDICTADLYGYHVLLPNISYMVFLTLCRTSVRLYGDSGEMAERIFRDIQYEGRE